MTFQITALPKETFAHLFELSDDALADAGAIRVSATEKPGFPCRVSLEDAEIGEEFLLVHYEHQPAATPFRASHAVYVRPGARTAQPAAGEVPAMLRGRILSLRAFDESGMLVGADLAEGAALEQAIAGLFADARVAYLHAHFAKPGCYAARIDRA